VPLGPERRWRAKTSSPRVVVTTGAIDHSFSTSHTVVVYAFFQWDSVRHRLPPPGADNRFDLARDVFVTAWIPHNRAHSHTF
jgi:hypothetical protein